MSGFYSNSSAGSSSENMANNSNYDMDSFLDFSGGYSTPTTRPGSQGTSSAAPSTSQTTPQLNTAAHLALSSTFAGPSYSYESFPQQTGVLPYNMTYPAMSGSGMSSSSNASVGKTSNSSSPKSSGMDVDDFSASFLFPDNTLDPDFVDSSNMNFDFNDDLDLLTGVKQERSTSNASMSSVGSSSYNKPAPRKSAASTDPATEERIRQILEDVKRRALAGDDDGDDASTPLPQLARMKKDEEDMDEDERLLASEEGKKLSSKERRQLRNKVSARAFRSRRKEYIGQLESEVATKANESAELRDKLRSVEAENKALKDLTHMLLASPQFSSFLDQLHPMTANNGLNLASLTAMAAPSRNENVAVHRVQVPEVQIQQPMAAPMDFAVPTYIPPHQQYLSTYNPHKDVNPVQQGVEDWPLAYPNASWGGASTVFAAEVPVENLDVNDLAGKSMFETGPSDGFRPGFFSPIKSDKEEAEPDYSNSYDKNGQYIYDVYEDELQDVPEYLYDHFEIHAPLSEQKQVPPPMKAAEVLPTLGLENLFAQLETMITEETDSTENSVPAPTQSCRNSDLFNAIESVERLHRRVGVYCGVGL